MSNDRARPPDSPTGRRRGRSAESWVRVCRACDEPDFSVVDLGHSAAASTDRDFWGSERERAWYWSCPHCGSKGAFRAEQRPSDPPAARTSPRR